MQPKSREEHISREGGLVAPTNVIQRKLLQTRTSHEKSGTTSCESRSFRSVLLFFVHKLLRGFRRGVICAQSPFSDRERTSKAVPGERNRATEKKYTARQRGQRFNSSRSITNVEERRRKRTRQWNSDTIAVVSTYEESDHLRQPCCLFQTKETTIAI